MNREKVITRLEDERAGIIEAGKVAQRQLTEAQLHVEKLKVCLIRLDGQKEAFERLLSDETFFEETKEEPADDETEEGTDQEDKE